MILVLLLLTGGIALFIPPDSEYSQTERRQLASPPELTLNSLTNGRFFTEADEWITDHFKGREQFRRMKAEWQLNILRDSENDGFAVYDRSIVKLEKEINNISLDYASGKLKSVYDTYLSGTNCRVYTSLIPDKSYYLAEHGYPVMDLDSMEESFYAMFPDAVPVSVKASLSLNDYYLTDSHWRQDRLIRTANLLLSSMGRPGDLELDDFDADSCGPFYGVYAGQSALDPDPDIITYLTGGPISEIIVTDYPSMQTIPVYDPEGCDRRDLYTLFLGGAKGFLRIENPAVTDGKQLVIFRDSFGSSIAPLLAARYSSVTLIDTRYFHPSLLKKYISFEDQDVLFLYSATLLNNSQALN